MNDKIIWDFLKSKKFTDAGCAGLMGNLYAESGLIPNNTQSSYEKKLGMNDTTYTVAVDSGKYKNFIDDRVGYGLAQWTYPTRKANLLKYAQSQGKSIAELTMQLNFLYIELTTSFPQLVKILETTTSVVEASNAVLLQFERPASKDLDSTKNKRASYGQKYYNQFHIIKQEVSKMKYSNGKIPIVCMQSTSRCYLNTKPFSQIKGVLWHSTGTNNPYISRYVQPADNAKNKDEMIALLGKNKYNNDYNHNPRSSSGLNAFVGKLADGTIASVQTMPWNYKPWGCGSGKYGSCNSGWIQFEICEDGLNDPVYFNKVYQESVELTAYLCKLYNLNPHGTVTHCGVKNVPVILCHADSNKLGLGSAHADVLHWFPKYGKSMETIRNDVAALLTGTTTTIPVNKQEEEDDDMTQEKFDTMMNDWLVRKANEKETWGTENLEWAKKNGIMYGDEADRMMPNKFCTRLETVTMLKRIAEKLGMK